MERFFEKMLPGLSPDPVLFSHLERAKQQYALRGEDILCFEKYGIFTALHEAVAEVRDRAKNDADSVLYCYLLSSLLQTEHTDLIGRVALAGKHKKDTLFDTLPLFALLDHVEDMTAGLVAKGFPQDVIAATRAMFEEQVADFMTLHGRVGVSSYVLWLLDFLRCRIIRVGRFNLEMTTYGGAFDFFTDGKRLAALSRSACCHASGRILGSIGCEAEHGAFFGKIEESEDAYFGFPAEQGIVRAERIVLPKAKWRRIVTLGTPVISVHIPSGGPLLPEVCDRDLARGMALIRRAFGPYDVFYCNSWMLDPQLADILQKSGNLTRFSDRFFKVPVKSNARSVFPYVFGLPEPIDTALLPETTTLARQIKAHLQSGGHIYGAEGIYLMGEEDPK